MILVTAAHGTQGRRLVAAHAPVRDILRAEGLEERLGYFGRRISVADAIDEFDGTNPAAPVPA